MPTSLLYHNSFFDAERQQPIVWLDASSLLRMTLRQEKVRYNRDTSQTRNIYVHAAKTPIIDGGAREDPELLNCSQTTRYTTSLATNPR